MSYRPATVQCTKCRKDWESTSRLDSVPIGGGGARRATRQHTRCRRCGGRRRDRRARAGFETRCRAKRGRQVSRAAGASGARNTSIATTNVSRETSAHPPAPLPRIARKVAHLTYTVIRKFTQDFMQRMACLDSAFDQWRHPGLVRPDPCAGKPSRPLVRRLRGPRAQPARIRDSSSLLRCVASRGRLPRWRYAEPEGPAPR